MNNEIEIRNKILEIVTNIDYMKGRNYNSNLVTWTDTINYNSQQQYRFNVVSERLNNTKYHVWITKKADGSIYNISCDCPQFDLTKSCKHVGACLWHYQTELFPPSQKQITKNITQNIFLYIKEINKKSSKAKQQIKVNLYLEANNYNYYYNNKIEIILEVGITKLYKCKGSKARSFIKAFNESNELKLGKDFTLNLEEQYVSKETEEILEYLYDYANNINRYSEFCIEGANVKQFLKLLHGNFILNDYLITDIKNEIPLNTTLEKENENYILKIDNLDKIKIITNDLEYIQIENTLYHTNKIERNFLVPILSEKVDKLSFSDEQLDTFREYIIPCIKNKLIISDEVDNVIITKKPSVKLYFDLYNDYIICNIKFIYNDTIIDYLDTDNKVIIRDKEFEDEVVNKIYNYDFILENNKIKLVDTDSIVYFLEEGLNQITSEYETYTTAKLKNINIVKRTSITSTFSIGKDNIMSYSFNLGNIDSKELSKIFDSIESKKKYYRMKSGDILSLEENDNLKEFKELTENMELTREQLKNESGEISKYKAIYLDSLNKNGNLKINKDNSFKKLIDDFYTYKDSEISLTEKDKKILRNYQIEGVRWLYTLTKTGFGGILADEMGLGKSIQTIYYIKELLKEDSSYKFLIVAPTSLVYNWENEFNKFAPDLKYKTLVGLKAKRKQDEENIKKINIIITTYGLLREDKEFYQSINFKTMIIDEAQNIKNVHTEVTKTVKSINAGTKFALTGTPIENSISELWSIFDYMMPGYLGNVKSFESKYKISDFDIDKNKIETLNKLIHPFILRRRKKDVIKDLPEKIENNIYVELTDIQKQIYLKELEYVNEEMNAILKTGGITQARFLILKLLTKLRQICIDPSIIYDNYTGGSGKMEEFIKVVKESVDNGHKILVFTSFKTALFLAQKNIEKEGITSYVIDGSTPSKKRMELVEKFNNDSTNVFFIMLKAGGTGLNLTGADVVIHLDLWWNPQAENQATDRAHRIGQKNVVEVIKFISKGTIEEKILELQNKKKILSDKLIDSDTSVKAFDKLTEKDIKELLAIGNKE